MNSLVAQLASCPCEPGVSAFRCRAASPIAAAEIAKALGPNLKSCAFEMSERFAPDMEVIILAKDTTLGQMLALTRQNVSAQLMFQTIDKAVQYSGERDCQRR